MVYDTMLSGLAANAVDYLRADKYDLAKREKAEAIVREGSALAMLLTLNLHPGIGITHGEQSFWVETDVDGMKSLMMGRRPHGVELSAQQGKDHRDINSYLDFISALPMIMTLATALRA